jgi:hypothetical protein
MTATETNIPSYEDMQRCRIEYITSHEQWSYISSLEWLQQWTRVITVASADPSKINKSPALNLALTTIKPYLEPTAKLNAAHMETITAERKLRDMGLSDVPVGKSHRSQGSRSRRGSNHLKAVS